MQHTKLRNKTIHVLKSFPNDNISELICTHNTLVAHSAEQG